MMEQRASRQSNFAAWFLFFALTTTTAFVLLLTALVVWITYATGSLITAALIVGGSFAMLSLIIYLATIREALARIREQIETIYEVASMARKGYEWVTDKIALFCNLRL